MKYPACRVVAHSSSCLRSFRCGKAVTLSVEADRPLCLHPDKWQFTGRDAVLILTLSVPPFFSVVKALGSLAVAQAWTQSHWFRVLEIWAANILSSTWLMRSEHTNTEITCAATVKYVKEYRGLDCGPTGWIIYIIVTVIPVMTAWIL